jgi:hypothetical protein
MHGHRSGRGPHGVAGLIVVMPTVVAAATVMVAVTPAIRR